MLPLARGAACRGPGCSECEREVALKSKGHPEMLDIVTTKSGAHKARIESRARDSSGREGRKQVSALPSLSRRFLCSVQFSHCVRRRDRVVRVYVSVCVQSAATQTSHAAEIANTLPRTPYVTCYDVEP